MTSYLLLIPLALAVTAGVGPSRDDESAYKSRMAEWRKAQEADLLKAEGWLSVAGLYWLEEGDNSIGTADTNKVILPAGTAPAHVGVVSMHLNSVTLRTADGVSVTVDGKSVSNVEFQPDATRAQLGDLTLLIIRRGNRTGIRLFDMKCKGRTEFAGMRWFPVNPDLHIRVKFVPYDVPRSLPITNVLGDTAPWPNPGYVEFTVGKKQCRLEALAQGSGLFFNFHDLTSGKDTYPAGRFLDAPAPKDGWVDLDFNQAVNPPCAFTKFATCPLPTSANFLPVAIRAGEKTHHPE